VNHDDTRTRALDILVVGRLGDLIVRIPAWNTLFNEIAKMVDRKLDVGCGDSLAIAGMDAAALSAAATNKERG